jgi:hypothetical protein
MIIRDEIIQEAAAMILSAREFCGNEVVAGVQALIDRGVPAAQRRAALASAMEAADEIWNGWRVDAGVRVQARRTDMQIKTIYADGRPATVQTVEHYPDLSALQKIVGGLIEYAPLPSQHDHVDFIVNEEGKLDGSAINEEATRLYISIWLTYYKPRELNMAMMTIHGDAVILEKTRTKEVA